MTSHAAYVLDRLMANGTLPPEVADRVPFKDAAAIIVATIRALTEDGRLVDPAHDRRATDPGGPDHIDAELVDDYERDLLPPSAAYTVALTAGALDTFVRRLRLDLVRAVFDATLAVIGRDEALRRLLGHDDGPSVAQTARATLGALRPDVAAGVICDVLALDPTIVDNWPEDRFAAPVDTAELTTEAAVTDAMDILNACPECGWADGRHDYHRSRPATESGQPTAQRQPPSSEQAVGLPSSLLGTAIYALGLAVRLADTVEQYVAGSDRPALDFDLRAFRQAFAAWEAAYDAATPNGGPVAWLNRLDAALVVELLSSVAGDDSPAGWLRDRIAREAGLR